jgi:hypothetical protein
MQHASLEQVGALARASRSRYGALIYICRVYRSALGELAGLRRRHIRLLHRTATETVAYAPQPFEVLPGELASMSVSPTRATAGTDVVLNVSGTLCRGADAQVDARIERAEEEPATCRRRPRRARHTLRAPRRRARATDR